MCSWPKSRQEAKELVCGTEKVAIQVNITPQGRMSLPAELRKRLGLMEGRAIFLEEIEDGLVLRTARKPLPMLKPLQNGSSAAERMPQSADLLLIERRIAAID